VDVNLLTKKPVRPGHSLGCLGPQTQRVDDSWSGPIIKQKKRGNNFWCGEELQRKRF